MNTKTKEVIIFIDNIEASSNEIYLEVPNMELVTIFYSDARNKEKEYSFKLNLN